MVYLVCVLPCLPLQFVFALRQSGVFLVTLFLSLPDPFLVCVCHIWEKPELSRVVSTSVVSDLVDYIYLVVFSLNAALETKTTSILGAF